MPDAVPAEFTGKARVLRSRLIETDLACNRVIDAITGPALARSRPGRVA